VRISHTVRLDLAYAMAVHGLPELVTHTALAQGTVP
jgi:hypothetical protein